MFQPNISAFAEQASDEQLPDYEESPLFLEETETVFRELAGLDWAFSDDDTRFLTHDLHPYPAKFIPQIPGNLISRLSSRGELVVDPFGGSGTTALEAVRMGRRALSIDANPVATLIGKVKTVRLDRRSANELHVIHGSLRAELQSLPHDPVSLIERCGEYAPKIANREKWFPDTSYGELALIRYRMHDLESQAARDIALLALSRTVLSVSFQDSETRYKSVPRLIPQGEAIRRFIKEFDAVVKAVVSNESVTRYGIAEFISADNRDLPHSVAVPNSADLVITSPPYGNATDYHLYHRFRLLWLGFDPVSLGHIEIGSHLRHQREKSGFNSYLADMLKSLSAIQKLLKPSRYAVFVIGDSVYEGKTYETAHIISENAIKIGFDASCIIERPIHRTKRSFTTAGRRATSEDILILRKASAPIKVTLHVPPYRLWPYEREIRLREIGLPLPKKAKYVTESDVTVKASLHETLRLRKLVFTHRLTYGGEASVPTWQAILENGMAANPANRKDPKYVTHGLHPYKGKFYPQLAKGLINLIDLPYGSVVLDPFCGSGTTMLESYLNGFKGYGADMNPLGAMIARAKTRILDVEPDVVTEVVSSLLESIDAAPSRLPEKYSEFNPDCLEEIDRWFAPPVAQKINWLLRLIRRVSAGALREFLEVILSSIIRDVSQQDPSDLRIRYRKEWIEDADVFGLFQKQLRAQLERVEKFWRIRGYSPNRFYGATVIEGDSRKFGTFAGMGLMENSVDLVLTSPPYATALPYIDTDRLSMLTILGIPSSGRRPLEQGLIGSREIKISQKKLLEARISDCEELPNDAVKFVAELLEQVRRANVGFRKENMPTLLLRFFIDMHHVLVNTYKLLKPGAEAMIVIGDNRIELDKEIRIPTTELIDSIAQHCGFSRVEKIDISVTTENLVHIRNAITENVVLRLKKPT